MPRSRLFAILAAAFLGLAALVLYGIASRDVNAKPPAALARLVLDTPKPAPEVRFADEKGGNVSLKDFRGRWVLLNLWASWCAPCVEELPSLAGLQSAMPAERFAVVAVSLGPEDAEGARAFLARHGADALAVHLDSGKSLIRAFGAYGLPLSVLVDPQGEEVARAFGPAEWDAPEAIAYLRGIVVPAR